MSYARAFFLAFVIAVVGAFVTAENLACTALGLKAVEVRFVGADGGPSEAGAR